MKVKFKCPSCGGTRLECVMDGSHTCPVTEIDSDGDFEYGPYESSADVDRWQCLTCGYTIKDSADESIIDNEEVVQWCVDNCEQEDN